MYQSFPFESVSHPSWQITSLFLEEGSPWVSVILLQVPSGVLITYSFFGLVMVMDQGKYYSFLEKKKSCANPQIST